MEAWNLGSRCGSPFHVSVLAPYTEDLGLVTGFEKVAVVTLGRLLSSFSAITFVSRISAEPLR